MRSKSQRWLGALLAVCLLAPIAGYWLWLDWLEHSQDVPILAAARRYGLDPALVKAVVWRESRFHPHIRGRVGELGLMQLREEAAREWAASEHLAGFAHEQCLDPATNTLAGTWYLKKALQHYSRTDNPVPYALAEYNAGRGNVLKWTNGPAATNSSAFVDQIGFRSTRAYVRAIVRRAQKYEGSFGLVRD